MVEQPPPSVRPLQLSASGTVAFFGLPGSFTHAAARSVFGSAADYRESSTISLAFESVASGAAEYGVVPIENSTEGGVNQTVDQLMQHDVRICGEVVLDIQQCLLGKATSLDQITRVASHPQGLAQCRLWLEQHLPHAVQVPALSTTAAAHDAVNDPTLAAISGPLAAELTGLSVIRAGIQDSVENATRFLVIAKRDAERTGRDKTSLVFTTAHSRGALRQVLEVFDHAGINLSRIESRPAPGKRWEYVFLTDLEGHRDDPAVAQALATLTLSCSMLRVLGSYPRVT